MKISNARKTIRNFEFVTTHMRRVQMAAAYAWAVDNWLH